MVVVTGRYSQEAETKLQQERYRTVWILPSTLAAAFLGWKVITGIMRM